MRLLKHPDGKPIEYDNGQSWKLAGKRESFLMIPADSKLVTVGDLKDQIGTKYPRPELHCATCGASYSAHAGDYWDVAADYVFVCCETPMRLGRKIEVFQEC